MTLRQDKVASAIVRIAAEFLKNEANPSPLITVTRADVSPDLKKASVFVSVLPEKDQDKAMVFLMRKQHALRNYAKKQLPIKRLPFFEFVLDKGERNRQRIDDALNES